MKVLITLPRLTLPGGVANYYSTLRKHLDHNKIYFEVGSRGADESIMQSVIRLFGDWLRFRKELETQAVDLVHINPSLVLKSLIRDGIFLLLAKHKQIKVVCFFRGWDPKCELLIRHRFARLFKCVFSCADAFIVLGATFKQKIIEFGIQKQTYLESTLFDDEIECQDFTLQQARGSGKGRILFLSRLDHGKGVMESLYAFEQLQVKIPSVEMTVAGDGPLKAASEQYVETKQLNNVEFTGHISGKDKDQAFKNADVYLFTSHHEGMPNSVLEAMAYGLPVVTSAVGGLKDFFEHNRMGKVIDPSDPSGICRALEELLGDPESRNEIGKYNCYYAHKHFAASSVAKRLVKIYEQVIDQSA
jgi:glycosyltransferase involved in cell wall biosynthesis